MSKRISFNLTDAEHVAIESHARLKGLKPATLAKNVLFTHMNSYSLPKGAFQALHRSQVQEATNAAVTE